MILASYVDRAPGEIVFRTETLGRPIVEASGDLAFSVANADESAVVAVGAGRSIGVDLEPASAWRQVEEVAERFLPSRSVADINAAPERQRPRLWVELWTEVEARSKLDGRGLSDLNADSAALLMDIPAHVVPLDLGKGFIGCLAYTGAAATVRLFDVDPADFVDDD
jgi:phosphopantetheinyl transferase